MQTGTATSAEGETRATSPQSAKRVLLYYVIGFPVALILLVLLIYAFSSNEHSPLEQKLIGRWMFISESGDETVITFRDDGMADVYSDGEFIHFWNAEGTSLQFSYQNGWWIDFWQRITGHSDIERYQILFHDDDTFEIQVPPLKQDFPSGDELFRRIKE